MSTTREQRHTIDGDAWAAMRERLEAERAELLSQLEETFDDPPASTATTGYGETEHVSIEVEEAVRSALGARAVERLVDLDDALRRIAAGTFGRCERCGDDIPKARLDAIAHVRYCVECQANEDSARRSRRTR